MSGKDNPGPRGLMEAMVAAHEAMDWDAAMELLSDDFVYQSMMGPAITDKSVIREIFSQGVPGLRKIEFRVSNVAVSGNVVFFERVDVLDIDGECISVPAVGVMETNDRIVAWREYFDIGELREFLRARGKETPF